jgi:hypothetical protein
VKVCGYHNCLSYEEGGRGAGGRKTRSKALFAIKTTRGDCKLTRRISSQRRRHLLHPSFTPSFPLSPSALLPLPLFHARARRLSAFINTRDQHGNTALHMAVIFKQVCG